MFVIRRTKDEYLKEVMRDNTQLLINKVWEVHVYKYNSLSLSKIVEIMFLPDGFPLLILIQLPIEKSDGFVFAKVSLSCTYLPVL